MKTITLDRGEFWEFKAREAACDLEVAQLRAAMTAVAMRKNALFDAFALRHGLDGHRPMMFEDTDLSVSQE